MATSSSSSSSSSSSWIPIPNSCDFTLQNFPFGVFSSPKHGISKNECECASAIGTYVIRLTELERLQLFEHIHDDDNDVCLDVVGSNNVSSNNRDNRKLFVHQRTLNQFMGKSSRVWKEVREVLILLFRNTCSDTTKDLTCATIDRKDYSSSEFVDAFIEAPSLYEERILALAKKLQTCEETLFSRILIPIEDCILHLPAKIGDYTDFYSSREHATNVGIMFRGKENALQPNWLHLPVGYHGRASSVFVTGTDIVRPCGQILGKDNALPEFKECQLLDFELEVGCFIGGPPNTPGTPVSMNEVNDRIFGFCLMNDWSARDIQKWEYVPLGPFGAKNFATTISPWIVTKEALEPYICATSACVQDNPEPLPYLKDPNYSSYDIKLTVEIQGAGMDVPVIISRSNYRNMYWNARQQLVHHSITGCNMIAGDLLGSGTISGSTDDSLGSMLELSWNGSREVKLGESGKVRKFLLDGDTVIIRGWAENDHTDRVGFGSCTGKIFPSNSKLEPGAAVGSWKVK